MNDETIYKIADNVVELKSKLASCWAILTNKPTNNNLYFHNCSFTGANNAADIIARKNRFLNGNY